VASGGRELGWDFFELRGQRRMISVSRG